MRTQKITNQIQDVREGKHDFSSLLDQIDNQQIRQKKVVPLEGVKKARQFTDELVRLCDLIQSDQ